MTVKEMKEVLGKFPEGLTVVLSKPYENLIEADEVQQVSVVEKNANLMRRVGCQDEGRTVLQVVLIK